MGERVTRLADECAERADMRHAGDPRGDGTILRGGDDGIDGAVELALTGSSVKALLEGDGGTLRSQVVDALTERFAEFTSGDAVLMDSSAWLVTARRP